MSELKFTRPTDRENIIELDSYLISAEWEQSLAYVGQRVYLEVYTSFVGQGAPIRIDAKSEGGQALSTIDDTIDDDYYRGEVRLADDFTPYDPIFFEVELPDNTLWAQCSPIPVFPPPLVQNLRWSKDKAVRGDILTLSATITNVRKGTRAHFVIYDYDPDGAHERVAEIPTTVTSPNVSVTWQYRYHGDRCKIPTYPQMEKYRGVYENPKYFFVVRIGTEEYGHDDRPFIDIVLEWATLNVRFKDLRDNEVVQAVGPERRLGVTDGAGFVAFENLLPGDYEVSILPGDIICLRLHDPAQMPSVSAPFRATFDGGEVTAKTDHDGWAEIPLPGAAAVDTVSLEWGGSHGDYAHKADVKLNINEVDAPVAAKLHNLGYHESEFSLEEAVCQFQYDYQIKEEMGLTGDGELPPKTLRELNRIYSSGCDALPCRANDGPSPVTKG